MVGDDQRSKSFFFQNNPVGYFQDAELPSRPGTYHYMPYRSVGHYRLHQALQTSGPQRCHYLLNGKERHFTVKSCPAYGRPELAEFETGNKD